jgi:hypothetical protein
VQTLCGRVSGRAIKPDGVFDFSACYNHNYQEFLGGFANWIDDIVESRSARDYARRVTHAETVNRWQSDKEGRPDLHVIADGQTWIRFVNHRSRSGFVS